MKSTSFSGSKDYKFPDILISLYLTVSYWLNEHLNKVTSFHVILWSRSCKTQIKKYNIKILYRQQHANHFK